MRLAVHYAGWLLALVTGACGSSAVPRRGPAAHTGATRAIIDDAGRSVTVAVPARRIVSLAPSITELLFALGVGDQVVGRTTWCHYPAAALAVADVGDGLNPDVEAVAALQPDLVLLYRSALTEVAARQLHMLGIPAAILRHDRIEDVSRTARLLGGLTGAEAQGDSVARELDSVLAAGPVGGGGIPPRVAFVVWDTPPIVIGGGSYLDELTHLAGGDNVFGDVRSASATVSLESIAARDPDWIAILTDNASSSKPPSWSRRPEWQVVRAVREGRFLYLSGDLFGHPSPRAPLAVTTLRRQLRTAP
jgi:iron complex transport system substrate-binding protein